MDAIKSLSVSNIKKIFIGGYDLLDKNKEAINNLNVFPVPDGDTGLNMSLTLKSVIKEFDNSPTDLAGVSSAISRGALKGARGNSGVITSQILKGMMNVVGKTQTGKLTTKVFASAIAEGAKVAYSAVTIPKEGTILTVVRVMGEEAVKIAKSEADFITFLTKVIDAGEVILAKTPDLLPVLKKAGVVDAGGRGLITIFRGFLAVLDGSIGNLELKFDADSMVFRDTTDEIADIEDIADIEFAYCTEFFVVNMKKTTLTVNIDSFREKLMTIGDSVICVGDLTMVKVHVHTNTPNIALEEALKLGEITKIKIENMLEQNRELRASRNIPDKEQGIVVISNGEGFNSLYKELGVDFVIKGGQTMNPSAQEIATACDRVHAKTVFVFPNNKNIVLAAMNAQSLTERKLIVIPTKNINEGVSAIVTYNDTASIEENTENFVAVSGAICTGLVTYAVRDTKIDDLEIKSGDIIGLDDKSILTKGKTPDEVAANLIKKMKKDKVMTITVYYGEGVNEKQAEALVSKLQSAYNECEITAINGGQNVYYYIISLE
jgi:DAK2 domain fusion protein YloV